jgi:hypothetical protein
VASGPACQDTKEYEQKCIAGYKKLTFCVKLSSFKGLCHGMNIFYGLKILTGTFCLGTNGFSSLFCG